LSDTCCVLACESNNVKILFLSANPVDRVYPLRIEQELRELRARVGGSPFGHKIEIVTELAVRPCDLQSALLTHQPDIVHFSGHCTENMGIVLEDDDGLSRVVSRTALSELFRILRGNIRLVVLNACFAKDQAEALIETIDCAIGMNAEIENRAAVVFAGHLYQSLAHGCSIEKSFELARNELEIEGIDRAHIPELLVRDGAKISEISVVDSQDPKSRSSNVSRSLISGLLFWPVSCGVLIIVADVLRRFLGGDSHWPDTVALIVQAVSLFFAVVFLFLIVAILLRFSNPSVERVWRGLPFHASRKPSKATLLSGVILILAFGLWISLPLVAKYLNKKGTNLQQSEPDKPALAVEAYRQALRLDPSYAQAHYNLAAIQESVQPDEAIEEYTLAIKCEGNLYTAYSNLARLYLLRGKEHDYENALKVLDQALRITPQRADAQYPLNKNLGWANYVLKHYSVAESYLRKAISLRNNECAGAHCLLAFVLKAEGKVGVAEECYACVSVASSDTNLEQSWLRDAKDYLVKWENR